MTEQHTNVVDTICRIYLNARTKAEVSRAARHLLEAKQIPYLDGDTDTYFRFTLHNLNIDFWPTTDRLYLKTPNDKIIKKFFGREEIADYIKYSSKVGL